VIPVVLDVWTLLEKLETGLSDSRTRVTVDQPDEKFGPPEGNPFASYEGSTWQRGIKESVTLVIHDAAWFKAWRLGLTNPWGIAWELVPLSFVIDWFVHLGPLIRALQQPLGMHVLHGYSSKYMSFDAIIKVRYPQEVAGTRRVHVDSPTVVQIKSRAFRRDPLIGVPLPSPYLDLSQNAGQVLTGLALMTSFLT